MFHNYALRGEGAVSFVIQLLAYPIPCTRSDTHSFMVASLGWLVSGKAKSVAVWQYWSFCLFICSC